MQHNTVFVSGTYSTPIEYRFPGTSNVLIANNLLDGRIAARDGASGAERGNYAGATASMFVDGLTGDLHLAATAAAGAPRLPGAAAAPVTPFYLRACVLSIAAAGPRPVHLDRHPYLR